jgi:hypothetical protein
MESRKATKLLVPRSRPCQMTRVRYPLWQPMAFHLIARPIRTAKLGSRNITQVGPSHSSRFPGTDFSVLGMTSATIRILLAHKIVPFLERPNHPQAASHSPHTREARSIVLGSFLAYIHTLPRFTYEDFFHDEFLSRTEPSKSTCKLSHSN